MISFFCVVLKKLEIIRSPSQNFLYKYRDFSLDICQLDKVLTQLFEACLTTHSETGLSPAMQRKAEDALQCFGGDPISKMKMLKKVLQEVCNVLVKYSYIIFFLLVPFILLFLYAATRCQAIWLCKMATLCATACGMNF